MSLDRRFDKENVVHNTTKYYLDVKKNKIMKFTDKWMELDKNHPK